MPGAGFAPAGFSPAGFGTVDAAPVPNTTALLPDAVTGAPQTGRLIDPATGDYRFTADGRIVGQGTAQQLVLLAVETVLGSSALATLGMDRSVIREKGRDLLATVTSMVNAAFADLVSRKVVSIDSVDVIDGPPMTDRAGIRITWTDLTTSQQQNTDI